jgi:hypothetical protein
MFMGLKGNRRPLCFVPPIWARSNKQAQQLVPPT